MKKIWLLILAIALILMNSCTHNSTETKPSTLKCTINSPADSSTITQGDSLILNVEAISSDNSLLQVLLLVDGDTLSVSNKPQSRFVWQTNQINPGDFYYDSGEPFVDWKRFNFDMNGNMSYSANGVYDNSSGVTMFDTMFFKNTFPGRKMSEFMQEVHIGNQTVCTSYEITGSDYRVNYPPESYFDLPSSYGSSLQNDLRYNQSYDQPDSIFDEFEAYCRPIKPEESSLIGNYIETASSLKFIGSYTVYEVPRPYTEFWLQHASLITPNTFSTWLDKNGNSHFDRAGGILDLSGVHKIKALAKDGHGVTVADSIVVFVDSPKTPGRFLK